MGRLPVFRRDRSPWRDKFAVAAIRDRESDARDYRAVRCDHRDDSFGQTPICLRHVDSASVAGRGNHDSGRRENLEPDA